MAAAAGGWISDTPILSSRRGTTIHVAILGDCNHGADAGVARCARGVPAVRPIVLFTDFGLEGPCVGQMKAVVAREARIAMAMG